MSRTAPRILIGIVALAGAFVGCVGSASPSRDSGKAAVAAAFYPLEFATEGVGRDLVEVEGLTASGVEPHDLELSADQIRNLSIVDLIVFVGGGFQPALEDAISGFDESRTLDVLQRKDLLRNIEGVEYEEEDGGDEPTADPHVWLDPSLMAAIVDDIAVRLAEIDRTHAQTYEANTEELKSQLSDLDNDFSEGLSNCASRDIVTSHAAFGYLAARYDLNQISISGIDPESEPSPGRLAEVARFVQENDVSTIFFEELVSPEVAETIAGETGARTAMLSPLESKPESGDYVDAMQANLATLTKALDCG
jgi:zinc transport system substrate-binding protein